MMLWISELFSPCRRMVETFVEVVRRGIENTDELSVTYTVPSRSDEDGEQADRDSEDLPDDLPDLVPPGMVTMSEQYMPDVAVPALIG